MYASALLAFLVMSQAPLTTASESCDDKGCMKEDSIHDDTSAMQTFSEFVNAKRRLIESTGENAQTGYEKKHEPDMAEISEMLQNSTFVAQLEEETKQNVLNSELANASGVEEYKDFAKSLAECLTDAVEDNDDLTRKRINAIVNYELQAKINQLGLASYNEELMAAIDESATSSAAALVQDQIHQMEDATIDGQGNVNAEAVEQFIIVLENAAKACGLADEAHILAEAEQEILEGSNDMLSNSLVHPDIPGNIMEACQRDVMDVDFLAAHGTLLTHKAQCLSKVSAELDRHSRNMKHSLNYRMKQVLVLHNKNNGLGHNMSKRWKRHGLVRHSKELHKELLGVAASPLSKTQLRLLRYLEDQHLSSLMAAPMQEICELKPGEEHMANGYRNCICVEGQLELVCQAKHWDDLQLAVQHVQRHFNETKTELRRNEAFEGRAKTGPCVPPFAGDLTVGGFSMSANAQTNIFTGIARYGLKTKADSCMGGSISFSWGSPAGYARPPPLSGGGCFLKLVMTLGVGVGNCNSAASFFSSFALSLSVEMCLGGAFGDLASFLGWNACVPIASISYYVFIGKLSVSCWLKTYLPTVKAELRLTAPVHDLTMPVEAWISNAHNDNGVKGSIFHKCDILYVYMPHWLGLFDIMRCQFHLVAKRYWGEAKAVRYWARQDMMNARGSLDIKVIPAKWAGIWHSVDWLGIDIV